MSLDTNSDAKYTIDLADRMAKAQRHSGMGVQELATRIQVSRNTVSRWINGHNEPRWRDIAAFALATGYSIEWLQTGKAPSPDDGTEGEVLPRLDSNQQPIGNEPGEVIDLAEERRARAARRATEPLRRAA